MCRKQFDDVFKKSSEYYQPNDIFCSRRCFRRYAKRSLEISEKKAKEAMEKAKIEMKRSVSVPQINKSHKKIDSEKSQ